MRKFECLNCKKEFQSGKFDKNRKPKFCSKKCYQIREKPAETLEKYAAAKRGKSTWNKGIKMWEGKEHPRGTLGKRGLIPKEKHHFWKGGKTDENMRVRKSADYSNWRSEVFKRDEYTCQECGQIGGRLNADHVLPFSTHPELRLELTNGKTLCVSCHQNTNTFGGKIHRKNKI
jgi:endogenous inhibitor of DNA gyrase (YacG/DUF329 family)